MNNTVYFERTEKTKAAMAAADIDALFLSPSPDLFYLAGYGRKEDERLCLLVLPREGEPFILENILYREEAEALPVKDRVYWKDGDDVFALFAAEIKKRGVRVKTAAVEPKIPALFFLPLRETFPASRFVLGSPLLDPLRQYKDRSELALIRKACAESDRALSALIARGAYWIGKTETDFFRELSSEFDRAGLLSFGASVQAGKNAAIPHYAAGSARIQKGACLLADFWGCYEGYYSDCTRTFHVGKPDREFETVYAVVLEAHLAAEAKAVPGNTLGEVDFAARSVIEKYGYGEYFTHRTGHGIGIDVHEGAPVGKGVAVPLEPGMVFSIEPGIYLPGRFGVRIENLVAIGEKGAEVLHAFPRELTVIE